MLRKHENEISLMAYLKTEIFVFEVCGLHLGFDTSGMVAQYSYKSY